MTAPVVWCFHDAPAEFRALFEVHGTETWLAHFTVPAETSQGRLLQVGNLALALHSDGTQIEGYLTEIGMLCVSRVQTEELLTMSSAL